MSKYEFKAKSDRDDSIDEEADDFDLDLDMSDSPNNIAC